MGKERKNNVMWLNRTLIELPLYFCLCITEKQFNDAFEHLGTTPPDEFVKNGAGATVHLLQRTSIETGQAFHTAVVCMVPNKANTLEQHLALLVHESVHIWQEVKLIMGEDNPSKEFEAYAIQHITQELFFAVKTLLKEQHTKKGRKNKKKCD